MTRQLLLTAVAWSATILAVDVSTSQAQRPRAPQVHFMTADDFLDDALGGPTNSSPGNNGRTNSGLDNTGLGGLTPSGGLGPATRTPPPSNTLLPHPTGTIRSPTTPGPKGSTRQPPCTICVNRPTGAAWLPPAPQPVPQPVFLGVVGHGCRSGGVHVNQVVSGSLAQRMGFESGDMILAINHRAVNNMDDLRAALAQPTLSFTFVIRNVRNGQIVSDTLRL